MAKELIIKNSIVIDAPQSGVWDALVNPEQTKKYMFGCETVFRLEKRKSIALERNT